VGLATDVYLLRVNFVGALGWELHFPSSMRIICSMRCSPPGAEFGIGMAGMRAMESLRLEKSYRMWGSDLTPTTRHSRRASTASCA
jgi:dimethylglycine dehydrogenase